MTFHKRLFKEKDTTPVYCEEPALAITIPVCYDEDGNRKQGLLSRARRGARGRRPFVSHKKLGKTNKMTKNTRAACAVCPVDNDF